MNEDVFAPVRAARHPYLSALSSLSEVELVVVDGPSGDSRADQSEFAELS